MTPENLVNFMHACLNLVGSITQTGILLHLLQLLLVVVVSTPGTLPAPFRVAFELLLLVEPSQPLSNAHICRCRPLSFLIAFFGRWHCLHRRLNSGAGAGARRTEALVGNQRRRGLALDINDIG